MYLNTQRLIIRDYAQQDLKDLLDIFSDPEVMKYSEPVYDEPRTKQLLDHFMDKPIAYGAVLRDTGKLIGHILFHQLPGEEDGIYEIGWFFNRNYWRQGFAFEACTALIDHGFRELGLHKICAETIDPAASVNLMQKLGMRHEGTFHRHVKDPEGNWADLYWYAIMNPKEE